MPIVQPSPIAPLPQAPYIGDPDFDDHADAHVLALTPHREQVNASADATYQNAVASRDSAQAAHDAMLSANQSEAAAAASVIAAAAAAGATKWAAGNYNEGSVVWSPANGLIYRRRYTGASGTDPSADPAGWWLLGAPLASPIIRVNANTAAQVGIHYVLEAPLTLWLPSPPQLRDVVQITDLSDSYACVIDPNGSLVRGSVGPVTLNGYRTRVALIYSGVEKGWI